jgi:hypothetical protein
MSIYTYLFEKESNLESRSVRTYNRLAMIIYIRTARPSGGKIYTSDLIYSSDKYFISDLKFISVRTLYFIPYRRIMTLYFIPNHKGPDS